MAAIDEIISRIRSEAIYGTDVREAIAQGIEHVGDGINQKITEYKTEVNQKITAYKNEIDQNVSTYKNDVDQVVSGYMSRLDTIEHDIEVEDLFVQVAPISENNYRAIITGATSN